MTTDWHTWLKENLREDQFKRLDAYDVQILVSIYKREKRLKTYKRKGLELLSRIKIEVNGIWRDVHGEMGNITEEQVYERLKRLSDMALIRVYVTFNRDIPEDL